MLLVNLKPTKPITEPVTKFGGQPVWLGKPQWPLAKVDGQPMRFICQVQLPDDLQTSGHRMAYIFMSDEVMGETWDAEAGDNAVILQPGPFTPYVQTVQLDRGPTLQAMRPTTGGGLLEFEDTEYGVELTKVTDEQSRDDGTMMKTRIGGPPKWMQNEEWPAGGPWRMLIQVDSCDESYSINFGDGGIGYVFISEDGRQARFLWQCL